MKDIARKILDDLNLGSSGYADIRFENSDTIRMQIRNGVTQEVTSTRLGGAAARALVKGAWGFATTTEIKKEKIKEILSAAVGMAKIASEKVKQPRKIDENFVTKGEAKIKFDLNPKDISLEEKMKLTQEYEKSTREVDEKIANTTATYQETIQNETIISSNGTDVKTQLGIFRLTMLAVSREGTLQQNVTDNIASSKGIKEIVNYNVNEKGQETGQKAIKLLTAEKPPSGKMNIVMDPSLVGVFVHEAFGHACESDGIITKTSILHDKLHHQVGVEDISIVDDPTLPGLRGSFVYDSEGTKSKPRKLVTKGILTEFFHTLETATLLNAKPNGAGRAQDFRFPPVARMGNTFIIPGDKSQEELFELIGDGMFLELSYGGYVHPAKGQFQFSAQNGFIIKKGLKDVMTQNVSMSGMILEVLANTIGVGNDMSHAFNGTCGKAGQWVPVTGGGPSLAVKDLVVGGR